MKLEAKHLIGTLVFVGLTALFRDDLAKMLRRQGWL